MIQTDCAFNIRIFVIRFRSGVTAIMSHCVIFSRQALSSLSCTVPLYFQLSQICYMKRLTCCIDDPSRSASSIRRPVGCSPKSAKRRGCEFPVNPNFLCNYRLPRVRLSTKYDPKCLLVTLWLYRPLSMSVSISFAATIIAGHEHATCMCLGTVREAKYCH